MVKVTLLTAKWCPECPSAKEIWRELRKEHDFEYEEIDVSSERGKELAEENDIRSVPVTLIDGNTAFIGIPDRNEAALAIQGKRIILGRRKL